MNSGFRQMNGRSRARGFTLIELMITIAVIAIAIGLGVPMYGTFTQGSAVSGATSEFIASLNDARSRAASERSRIRVEAIDDDWANGWKFIQVAEDNVFFTVARNDKSVYIVEADGETTIDFDPEGRADERAFTIGIAGSPGGSPVRNLEVSKFGRIGIETSYAP